MRPAILPAHSASCDCCGEALAADRLTATVSEAICGQESGPQVSRATVLMVLKGVEMKESPRPSHIRENLPCNSSGRRK